MADADFEHLLNEESQAEAQALGTATEDQARALDEDNAISANERELPQKSFVDEDEEPDAGYQTAEDADIEEVDTREYTEPSEDAGQGRTKAFIGDAKLQDVNDNLDEAPGQFSDIDEDDEAPTPAAIATPKVATVKKDAKSSAKPSWQQSTYRVGLSKTQRIPSLLKVFKK